MKVNRGEIRVAIAGLGNCASALIQAVSLETISGDLRGVKHKTLGGYSIGDIKFVAAFDVNTEKIGCDISEAIFRGSNCTEKICDVPFMDIRVQAGPILDGVAPHMREEFSPHCIKKTKEEWKKDIVAILRGTGVEILLNYMPVGSEKASRFYAECALDAGCAFVNCMPTFIVSDPAWAKKFEMAGLPCIGDDVKSQIGASILNRYLAHLFDLRESELLSIYQHNTGNNSDFRNMREDRMVTKYISKTETVTSNIIQRPSFDLVCNGQDPNLVGDHKVCDLRFRAIVCGTKMTFDSRLEVVDSYNSAGVVIDAIRITKIALVRELAGPVIPACAFFMKHPPQQMEDNFSSELLERWIADGSRTIVVPHSRIKQVAESGQTYSEVWTNITEDLMENAKRIGVHLEYLSLKDKYHDEAQYLRLVFRAIDMLNDYSKGYERALVLPFSLTDPNLRLRLRQRLRECPDIHIYAVNVPPDEEDVEQLPNLCGYAGLDEYRVGEELFRELTSRTALSKILVVKHQKNRGLELRIEGIRKMAADRNCEIVVCGSYEYRHIKSYIKNNKDVGIITLGCRGTEAILRMKIPTKVPLVCMDMNGRIKDILLAGANGFIASFLQEHLYGGVIFSGRINITFEPVKITLDKK